MLNTMMAVVRNGRIELLEGGGLPEGARLLVTPLPEDDSEFWMGVSQEPLDAVWDTTEDDVYVELLGEGPGMSHSAEG